MINLNYIIKNSIDLLESDYNKIASLKKQHWNYGITSQIDWINNNYAAFDKHLLCENQEGELVAYLALVEVEAFIDDDLHKLLGVSCVCVSKELLHKGFGIKLMSFANKMIKEAEKGGILLCKSELVPFYTKCSWRLLSPSNVTVNNNTYQRMVMSYPKLNCDGKRLFINRVF